jgi:hypothetical protein
METTFSSDCITTLWLQIVVNIDDTPVESKRFLSQFMIWDFICYIILISYIILVKGTCDLTRTSYSLFRCSKWGSVHVSGSCTTWLGNQSFCSSRDKDPTNDRKRDSKRGDISTLTDVCVRGLSPSSVILGWLFRREYLSPGLFVVQGHDCSSWRRRPGSRKRLRNDLGGGTVSDVSVGTDGLVWRR